MSEHYDFSTEFQRLIVLLSIKKEKWLAGFRPYVDWSFFEDPSHQLLVREATEFFDQHGIAPDPRVLEELVRTQYAGDIRKTALTELKRLSAVEPSESAESFISDRIVRFASTQNFRKALIEAASELESGNLDSVVKSLDVALSFASAKPTDEGMLYFDDSQIDARTAHDIQEDAASKIATLFPTMDNMLRGGSAKKELHTFMAPPYRGKSMGLINIGAHALFAGANVVHITVEMSKEKSAMRYDMKLSGMSYEEISEHPQKFAKKMKQFRSLYKGNLIIKEYPARSVTPHEIEAYIKMLMRRKLIIPDLVVIDYADELKRPKMDNQAYALGDVYSALRAMATRLDVAVWTATQTTRQGFNKTRLDMDDVADSWEKAKISDVIIAMSQTEEEEKESVMRWYFIKNRNNDRYTKPIPMKTLFKVSTFKEVTLER